MVFYLVLPTNSRKMMFSKNQERMLPMSKSLTFFLDVRLWYSIKNRFKKNTASLLETNWRAVSPVYWHLFAHPRNLRQLSSAPVLFKNLFEIIGLDILWCSLRPIFCKTECYLYISLFLLWYNLISLNIFKEYIGCTFFLMTRQAHQMIMSSQILLPLLLN